MIDDPPLLASLLLKWWPDVARDLPWRHTRDPWLVLVSEVMSQQTQVSRVVPKWFAFIERFPTPAAAAAVPAGDLISMWVGLGYNRRALMLHRCAGEIVERHDGRVPDTLDDLLALSGIGPYTARAVLAFAFEADVGVVDTNVGRVLARLGGSQLDRSQVQQRADALVPAAKGWEWNQALLDFGAQICEKRAPHCDDCPVMTQCCWRGAGPDPADGSAGVSVTQSRFEGSDRQGRANLVSSLRNGPLTSEAALAALGFGSEIERAERVLASLITDGLVVAEGNFVSLP